MIRDGSADPDSDPDSDRRARAATPASRSLRRRLLLIRGRWADALRRFVGTPFARRVPIRWLRAGHRYGRAVAPELFTDADPFKIVTVDPFDLERSILETAPAYPQWGRVQGGDWDERGEPFAARPVTRAIRARFVDGVPWEETPLYEHFADQLRRFGNAWGYTSMAQFDRRCAEIERLYESIRDDGYRRQSELSGPGYEGTIPVFDEINVDVGRDGEFLWRKYGQHRLAIARVLEIPRVPALIHRRHREWQSVRDARRSVSSGGGAANRHRGHPDLRALDDGWIGSDAGESP